MYREFLNGSKKKASAIGFIDSAAAENWDRNNKNLEKLQMRSCVFTAIKEYEKILTVYSQKLEKYSFLKSDFCDTSLVNQLFRTFSRGEQTKLNDLKIEKNRTLELQLEDMLAIHEKALLRTKMCLNERFDPEESKQNKQGSGSGTRFPP